MEIITFEILMNIVIILLSMFIHEIGHWLGFLFFGVESKMSIKTYGMSVDPIDTSNIRMTEFIAITLAGIVAGYLVVLLSQYLISIDSLYYFWIYLSMCVGDFANLIMVYIMLADKTFTISSTFKEIDITKAKEVVKKYGIESVIDSPK